VGYNPIMVLVTIQVKFFPYLVQSHFLFTLQTASFLKLFNSSSLKYSSIQSQVVDYLKVPILYLILAISALVEEALAQS